MLGHSCRKASIAEDSSSTDGSDEAASDRDKDFEGADPIQLGSSEEESEDSYSKRDKKTKAEPARRQPRRSAANRKTLKDQSTDSDSEASDQEEDGACELCIYGNLSVESSGRTQRTPTAMLDWVAAICTCEQTNKRVSSIKRCPKVAQVFKSGWMPAGDSGNTADEKPKRQQRVAKRAAERSPARPARALRARNSAQMASMAEPPSDVEVPPSLRRHQLPHLENAKLLLC